MWPWLRCASLSSLLVGTLKGNIPNARQLFMLVAACILIRIRLRHFRHIAVIERHRKDAQQGQNDGHIGDDVPSKAFFTSIVVPAPWTIVHRIMAQIGVPALRTSKQLGALSHRVVRMLRIMC